MGQSFLFLTNAQARQLVAMVSQGRCTIDDARNMIPSILNRELRVEFALEVFKRSRALGDLKTAMESATPLKKSDLPAYHRALSSCVQAAIGARRFRQARTAAKQMTDSRCRGNMLQFVAAAERTVYIPRREQRDVAGVRPRSSPSWGRAAAN